MAGSIAAAIFVVEKTVIQLLSINYYRKQYARKIRESKRLIRLLNLLYETSRRLFPEFSKEFEHEDTEIHCGTSLIEARDNVDGHTNVRDKILINVHRAREKAAAAIGALKSDVASQELGGTSNLHSVVSKALESDRASKALARRLWLSLCSSGKDAVYKQDIQEVLGPQCEAEAEEIFNILDRDGNGDVSLDEMTAIVVNCGRERKDRASSIQDISSAIAVLDKILSTIVVIGKLWK
ncbi:hypothetical protein PRZ48_010117 [Zasmidium cellare]|uniref:EF-hand domain-containing protein n=1 Tax=Zasmidium cellare TaxID=395010 RepID=A0ABR0EDM3_ZASCE|nr:hypothetical protein PRZ48_010117 [Zasmidium cellare]